jgi:DNA-binding NarL/FixJ family response regulator
MKRDAKVAKDKDETVEWLRALFSAPSVGLAVFDNQLRFQAGNKAFASMLGMAPKAHLGKTIHKVLGKAATKLEVPVRYVLSSGRDLSNFEIRGKLPRRKDVGCWTMSFFPIRDASGLKQQVGVVVLETTEQTNQQRALCSVMETLFRNLLLSSDHSDVLLRRIMQGSLRNISVSEANRIESAVTGSSNQGNPETSLPLTPREREVFKLLADGHGNKGTAAILRISVKTVEAHRAAIMSKLGLHSTRELMRYAINNSIVELTDSSRASSFGLRRKMAVRV